MFSKHTSIALVTLGVNAGLTLLLTRYLKHRLSSRRQIFHRTIFFPDEEVACKEHFSQRHGCTSQRCRYSHDESLAYAIFLRSLTSARRSLDICVFVITCTHLADVVIGLHDMGIIVRIITDGEQVDARGSQINRFRAAGIQVRINKTSFLMHHKFCIVDKCLLINGSFNWTRQAITGNEENMMLCNEPCLLQDFKSKFELLWELFDPTKNKQS